MALTASPGDLILTAKAGEGLEASFVFKCFYIAAIGENAVCVEWEGVQVWTHAFGGASELVLVDFRGEEIFYIRFGDGGGRDALSYVSWRSPLVWKGFGMYYTMKSNSLFLPNFPMKVSSDMACVLVKNGCKVV